MRHKTPKISSIEKALNVLTEFTRSGREMGTVELSQNLGFHVATVSRMLQILRQKGFIQHNEKTRKFSLGPSSFELGRAVFRLLQGNLLQIALPWLVDLCEQVGETVVLETMSGCDLVVTYIAQGRNSLTVAPKIGDKLPFHVSPGGKSILAFSDPKTVDNLLAGELEKHTPNTITDRVALARHLEGVRKQGFAFSREEMLLGVHTVGAPIFDHDNRPVAAVVIVGLVSRIASDPHSPLLAALLKTARDISAQLFHHD
ncbi:MAG: IclR family transcriptional regulator [Syntrophorhabdales bacterium]|jgi:DNA-binding IclR family transcriptional regulator